MGKGEHIALMFLHMILNQTFQWIIYGIDLDIGAVEQCSRYWIL